MLHILRKDQGNQNISESILSSDHHISSITQISLKKPTQIGKRLFYQRNKKDCFIPFRNQCFIQFLVRKKEVLHLYYDVIHTEDLAKTQESRVKIFLKSMKNVDQVQASKKCDGNWIFDRLLK